MYIINIIFIFSYLKRKLLSIKIKFLKKSKVDEDFRKIIIYPTKSNDLDNWLVNIHKWVEQNNPYGLLDKQNIRTSEFKKYLRNLTEIELFNLHKYYNVTREFNKAVIVFHEILKRELKISNIIFVQNGFKRYIAAKMLLSQTRKNNYINSRLDNFLLKTFFLLISFKKKRNFHNLVKNKTISLVGGGAENNKSAEIDASDLVARLNTFEINEELKKQVGSRVDIVFMRSVRSKKLYEDYGTTALYKYKNIFFNFKNSHIYNLFNTDNKILATKANSSFPYGGLNAVQGALFELSYYGCKKINIYGVDFHLLSTHLKGYYPKNMPNVKFELTFGEHPSYIQYLVTKYFLSKNIVEHKGDGNEVLKLEYRFYLKTFFKKYSNNEKKGTI